MRPAENIAFFADFRLRRRDAAQSRACITFAIRHASRAESPADDERHTYGTLMT
jgi:hypothetical protein